MGLILKFLILPLIFLLLINLCHCKDRNRLNKMVRDNVELSCNYNISSEELMKSRIYWQKENDDVVMTIIEGQVEKWPKYMNRTFSLTSNLSIVILGLRPSDSGIYSCVIQKYDKVSFKVEYLTEVELLVKADFSVPNITELENATTTTRRISCSTFGGFPKPSLYWLENGEELNATNTKLSQDPDTELYSISSELEFNVTTNHSFVCLVKYGDLNVSETYNWQKNEPEPYNFSQPWHIIGPLLLVLLVILIIAAAAGICHYRQRSRGRRNREVKRVSSTDL